MGSFISNSEHHQYTINSKVLEVGINKYSGSCEILFDNDNLIILEVKSGTYIDKDKICQMRDLISNKHIGIVRWIRCSDTDNIYLDFFETRLVSFQKRIVFTPRHNIRGLYFSKNPF